MINISDINGRMLKLIRGEFARGYNQVRLNSAELPAAGVLYYAV